MSPFDKAHMTSSQPANKPRCRSKYALCRSASRSKSERSFSFAWGKFFYRLLLHYETLLWRWAAKTTSSASTHNMFNSSKNTQSHLRANAISHFREWMIPPPVGVMSRGVERRVGPP